MVIRYNIFHWCLAPLPSIYRLYSYTYPLKIVDVLFKQVHTRYDLVLASFKPFLASLDVLGSQYLDPTRYLLFPWCDGLNQLSLTFHLSDPALKPCGVSWSLFLWYLSYSCRLPFSTCQEKYPILGVFFVPLPLPLYQYLPSFPMIISISESLIMLSDMTSAQLGSKTIYDHL